MDLSRLSALVAKTADLQSKLYELEKQKSEALVRGDVAALEEIMKREQPFLMDMAGTEKRREALSEELGLSGMTLLEVARAYDRDNRYRLREWYNALSDCTDRLKKLNGINSSLIQTRLRVIDECISLLGDGGRGLTYTRDGTARR